MLCELLVRLRGNVINVLEGTEPPNLLAKFCQVNCKYIGAFNFLSCTSVGGGGEKERVRERGKGHWATGKSMLKILLLKCY